MIFIHHYDLKKMIFAVFTHFIRVQYFQVGKFPHGALFCYSLLVFLSSKKNSETCRLPAPSLRFSPSPPFFYSRARQNKSLLCLVAESVSPPEIAGIFYFFYCILLSPQNQFAFVLIFFKAVMQMLINAHKLLI